MRNIYHSILNNCARIIFLFFITGSISFSSSAQVANYAFSQFSGTYTPLFGATVLVDGVGTPAQSPTFNDDTNYPLLNIGFTFNYNGTPYTQIGISDNGFIRLGVATTTSYAVLQAQTNVISAFNEDLLGNSATHELRYLVSGTPGTQVFTIEWFNWGFYNVIGNELNFQIKLFEATGEIQFVYEPVTPSITGLMKVGINGTPVTDFNSRTTTTDWTATTASPLNTSSCTFNATVFPPSGLTFSWILAPIDMAATTLVTPVPNVCYTANETVTVRVRNFGSQIIDFSVNPLAVNCSSTNTNPLAFPQVILNSGTLAVAATQDVVITTTYDMTIQGMYTFTASTSVIGDGNPANDVMAPVNIDGNIVAGVASTIPASDTICAGSPVTLNLSGYTGGIQWQSYNGVTWINETGPGNNTASYSVSPLADTDYRALVCGSAASNTISIIVVIVAPPTTTGDTRCGYGIVNLTAAGVGNLNWYANPTGGSSLYTGTNYSPTVGVTTTYYVESSIGSANTSPVTTTFASGNGFLGNMFDITATNGVTITHFDGHMTTGTANWEVWYRPGSFVGFNTSNAGWTLLGTASNVVAAGLGVPTVIPIYFSVPIPAGQTYAFYVTALSGTVNYTNGTAVGNVFASDANIQVREGNGGGYFAVNNSPRVFNGKVYYDSGCTSTLRTPVTAIVTVADSVVVTTSQPVICGLPASTTVTLNASSANALYNYTWTGADLNQTTGPSVTATPNATTTYIVTGDDGTCADSAAITIILAAPPVSLATAAPSSVCLGSPSQLSTPPAQITYAVNSIPYSPVVFTGNAGPVGDNVLSGVQPIGFTFNFFGTNYTSFNISTNGNIQFGPTFSTSGVPAVIPTAAAPNNYIGSPWGNLSTVIGGNITWATLGTSPNQMLVVSYNSMGFNTGGGFLDGQIILYEGSNCIEVHAGLVSNTTLNKVIGIENQNGTLGYAAPGRNSSNWNLAVPEAWSFCPVSPYTFVWNPVTDLNNPTIYNPVATLPSTGNFTYDVTVTDLTYGCTSTSSVTISVLGTPAAPTTVGDTRCGFGVVNLSAAGVGILNWYTNPTGGSLVNSGPTYSPMVGTTTTYYVEATVGSATAAPLTTTFAAGNGSAGNMFDITALGNVTITHFDAHVATGTHTFKVWYRPGSYVGFQNDSSTWTLLGTATGVVAAGAGVPTPVPITFAVPIPAGQTYGFYVTSTTGTVSYTNGTAVGNVFVQDGNIQVREGHGGAYFNLINNPRVFNGIVYYESGCPSATRTPVTATVTPADTIIASTTSNPMCSGNPVTISISSTNTSYAYTWSPAIGLSSTTGNSVTANPPFSTLYTINALDTAACATSTTVNLVVNPSPVIVATANPVTVCAGSPAQLDVNNLSQPIVFTVGTGTVINTATTYPAPYGNFYWGARHQMLITVAELNAAGLTAAGNIYSLGFDVVSINTSLSLTNFEIKLMNTGAVNMSAWLTGLTSHYLNPTYTPAVGWNTHTFSTPFYWDGVSNIVVETCFNNTAPFTENCTMRQTNAGYIASRWYRADVAGVCANTTTTTGTSMNRPNMQFGIPSPYNYLWTPNATLNNDTIVNPVGSPTSTTTYTVSIHDNYYNCTSTSSITVNVNPLPVVTLTPLTNICIDASSLPLSGGTPSGGTFSGTGVSNNIFYPSVSGIGTFTIYYTYTDNLGCSGTDSSQITVNPLPVVTMPAFPVICETSYPVNLTTGAPNGGNYSGPGVTSGVFDPTVTGDGIFGITYTYTDANGCTNSAYRNITVNESPAVSAGADILGNSALNGSATGGTPPYTYVWYPCLSLSNCNTPNPVATPAVNTFYVLVVIDANGCYSSDTVLVTSTVGIATTPSQNVDFLIYPNPSSGVYNILFINSNDKADITVTDIIGQQVFSSGSITAPSQPYQLDLTSQPDGMYLMQVKYKDRIFTTRLVMNK